MRYLALVLALVLLPIRASGEVVQFCWTDTTWDAYDRPTTVTRCRVSGTIIDYASEYEVPLRLYPAVSSATNGTCWYWRTAWTGWEMITRYSDGSAAFGFDSDGTPGGPLNVDVTYPVCTSEPVGALPTDAMVWDLVRDYIHQIPEPALNPAVPWGLTGAETHLGLTPPPTFADSIAGPNGGELEVFGSVAAITVDWGDGSSLTLAPETYPLLSGYPDGAARHTYEVKTCEEPGSTPRCHPSLSSYPLEVRYQWFVQWRIGTEAWTTLDVPDTTATITY
ncbi:MAG: hypothetical protein JJE47_14615, partial [Acidimicrobiia bacterium]|nr:hypothetical protein [Acidimicrobiia bacterium]